MSNSAAILSRWHWSDNGFRPVAPTAGRKARCENRRTKKRDGCHPPSVPLKSSALTKILAEVYATDVEHDSVYCSRDACHITDHNASQRAGGGTCAAQAHSCQCSLWRT